MFNPSTDRQSTASNPARSGIRATSAEQGSALQTILVVLAAIAIVGLAFFAVLRFSAKPVEPTGSIEQLAVFPIHRNSMMGGGNGSGAAVNQGFDQLFVLAQIKVENPGKIPVFVKEIAAEVSLPQGETHTSAAAGGADFNRIFVAYPEMAPRKGPPLLRETTIEPGASSQGLVAFAYPLTKEQWDTHTGLNVTISFVHQADLVLKAPNP